jgi:hypothetical protein
MGIHRLRRPPDSPETALRDVWLFGYLKMKLEGMFLNIPTALLAEVEEILGDIRIMKWAKVFHEWNDRLKRGICRRRIS